MNAARRWRRTGLTRYDGQPVPDDWTLVGATGRPLGRVYKTMGGPMDGRWFWIVLINFKGQPWNGGTGYCAAGREAKEAVEARD